MPVIANFPTMAYARHLQFMLLYYKTHPAAIESDADEHIIEGANAYSIQKFQFGIINEDGCLKGIRTISGLDDKAVNIFIIQLSSGKSSSPINHK